MGQTPCHSGQVQKHGHRCLSSTVLPVLGTSNMPEASGQSFRLLSLAPESGACTVFLPLGLVVSPPLPRIVSDTVAFTSLWALGQAVSSQPGSATQAFHPLRLTPESQKFPYRMCCLPNLRQLPGPFSVLPSSRCSNPSFTSEEMAQVTLQV